MSACRRFEEEALERIERGLPLDPHFENCPECRREAERYRQVRKTLTQGPGEIAPPEGWRDAVWQYVDEQSGAATPAPSASRKSTWVRLAWASAAAVLLAFLVRVPWGPAETDLFVRTERGGDVMRRNTEVQVGDEIIIRATVDGDLSAQLRIYRDEEELLVDCSDVMPCRRSGDRLDATYTIGKRGQYEVILIVVEGEIPPSTGSLDADVGAASRAGCDYKLSKRITAR